jgi:hypothetical protein
MSERKILTITQVEEVKKVGDRQIPKLSFRAREGDNELAAIYFTFRPNLFEAIKEGQIIIADVETEQKGEYTNRKVTQIYAKGQPIAVKRGEYRGKSPEELEQQGRVMVLSYAKDLAVAQLIPLDEIPNRADVFYTWLKGNKETPVLSAEQREQIEKIVRWEKLGKMQTEQESPTGKVIQDLTQFKGLMASHKIGTAEVKEILSISKLDEIKDYDEAWGKIKKAKGIES